MPKRRQLNCFICNVIVLCLDIFVYANEQKRIPYYSRLQRNRYPVEQSDSVAEVAQLISEHVYEDELDRTELQSYMPNVCKDMNPRPRTVHQKFKTPYAKVTKVWKPNCGYQGNWCVQLEKQIHHVIHYKSVLQPAEKDQYKCCPGFTQQAGKDGCVPKSNCSQFVQFAFACQNGGLCYENNGVVRCSCPAGYTGVHCQIQIDDCASGTGDCERDCARNPKSNYCRCPAGYYLAPDRRRCLDIDECKHRRGGCMYFCENLPGGYRCACPSDMMLAPDKISCVPCKLITNAHDNVIGETKMSPLCGGIESLIHASTPQMAIVNISAPRYLDIATYALADLVIDWPTTRNVVCHSLIYIYRPSKLCFGNLLPIIDRDECLTGEAVCYGPAINCINEVGSYRCECQPGFRLSADGHSCQDIDECLNYNGGCQYKCVNTPGSFQCLCNMGDELNPDGLTCSRSTKYIRDQAFETNSQAIVIGSPGQQRRQQNLNQHLPYNENGIQTGACTCQPGYRPPDCILPCPYGYFGVDCKQTCFDCTGGCDPVTGRCTVQCPPGKLGTKCERAMVLMRLPEIRIGIKTVPKGTGEYNVPRLVNAEWIPTGDHYAAILRREHVTAKQAIVGRIVTFVVIPELTVRDVKKNVIVALALLAAIRLRDCVIVPMDLWEVNVECLVHQVDGAQNARDNVIACMELSATKTQVFVCVSPVTMAPSATQVGTGTHATVHVPRGSLAKVVLRIVTALTTYPVSPATRFVVIVSALRVARVFDVPTVAPRGSGVMDVRLLVPVYAEPLVTQPLGIVTARRGRTEKRVNCNAQNPDGVLAAVGNVNVPQQGISPKEDNVTVIPANVNAPMGIMVRIAKTGVRSESMAPTAFLVATVTKRELVAIQSLVHVSVLPGGWDQRVNSHVAVVTTARVANTGAHVLLDNLVIMRPVFANVHPDSMGLNANTRARKEDGVKIA
ncbi:uncharacterized protein DEA37_0007922 [Paragonimus westermani]|uniref:EGF-like domain-containing protein n=1 Tax=Paragonimus westermani TaxID=34504 RepID=A0A5J4NZF2_9TREM|nr:uncharacterized protein DEA37_0007922 [Paragonimus westermani]